MLVKALCDYYEILAKRGVLVPNGRSTINVKYVVDLSPGGDIVRIRSVQDKKVSTSKKGKQTEKYVPKSLLFPKRLEVSAICANIVDHRPSYIFGLENENGEFCATDKAKKSHAAFVTTNKEFFAGLENTLSRAFYGFVCKEQDEEQIVSVLKRENLSAQDFGSARYAFCLDGYPNAYLNEVAEVLAKFDAEIFGTEKVGKTVQCSILGTENPCAATHAIIKGVAGGQPSGCKLVCVNNTSEESFGDEQGAVGKVSQSAMERYAAALNYMLSDDGKGNHCRIINGMTVVFWSNGESDFESDIIQRLLFAPDKLDVDELDKNLASVWSQIKCGRKPDFSVFGVNADAEYFMAGLLPNASRLAVKFFYRNTFGNIMKSVLAYHADFAHENLSRAPAIKMLCEELLPKESEKSALSPDFIGKMLSAMIAGTPYPRVLLDTAVRRVKTDKEINDCKIGFIKAYLNRKNKTEVITMSLNSENTSPAYLSGRLFAVLEALQKKASNDKLNRTIKDAYFASACATPASVFPQLIKLAQNHLKKVDDSFEIFYSKKMSEVIDLFDGAFPKTLSLEQQGEFIVGYYQQLKNIYTKKDKE